MSEAKKQIKGNKVVIKCLEHQGVDLLFAYPGGFSMELHQALQESDMRVILPRHEQGGAFAANGYAKASGRVGVCMATSGPGATNLLSGIADAYMDSVPTVFITGQVPTTMIGKNVFQETDIIGMTRPIVKHSYLVLEAKDLPRIFNEAFYLAKSGRPGPVMVDIPKNIQQQMLNEDEVDYDCEMDIPTYKTHYDISPEDVKAIKADDCRDTAAARGHKQSGCKHSECQHSAETQTGADNHDPLNCGYILMSLEFLR